MKKNRIKEAKKTLPEILSVVTLRESDSGEVKIINLLRFYQIFKKEED